MLGTNHKYCVGKEFCEYSFCTNKNKCLWLKKPKCIVNNVIDFTSNISKGAKKLINIGHQPFCICCGSEKNLTFDHVIPLSKGGINSLANGQILCKKCNTVKGDEILTVKELRKKLYKAI
jgi:5-methylcytosine-specific restriction endonuclease McrA